MRVLRYFRADTRVTHKRAACVGASFLKNQGHLDGTLHNILESQLDNDVAATHPDHCAVQEQALPVLGTRHSRYDPASPNARLTTGRGGYLYRPMGRARGVGRQQR